MKVVTKCKDCRFFQKQTTKHANPLRPIDLSWPFVIWGIDIVGILPRAPGGFRFLFVTIDTFTKWMEAMPVVKYRVRSSSQVAEHHILVQHTQKGFDR
jgi:hypothetical protein